MLTHAYLNNLANLKTTQDAGRPLFASARFVFATGSSGGGSQNPEKSDDEKKREEEEKKKEQEEKEKKTNEEKEKDKKKKEKAEGASEEGGNVDFTKKRISEMARAAVEKSEKVQKEVEKSEKKEFEADAEKLKDINKEFQRIDKEDAKAQKPVKDYLTELVTTKKITKKQARKLLELDPGDDDFEKKWNKAVKKIPGLEKDSPEVIKLLRLKREEGEKVKALDKRMKKAMHEQREILNKVGDKLLDKARQRRALIELEKATGLNVKTGQALNYKDNEKDKDQKEPKVHRAVIKDVKFEEINVEDEEGNVVGKVKTNNPVVTVESINPYTGRIEEDKFSTNDFYEWTDDYDVLEDIDSYDKLSKSIGEELREGGVLEYHITENKGTDKEVNKDEKVEIKKLDKDNHRVVLDKDVKTSKGLKKEFNFDEFAKWFKQNEVMKEVENLEKLRHELHAFNEKQNTFYERSGAQYPPVEAKDGEVLYFDDDIGKEFVIKKVHEKDKKIEFEGGTMMSFTAFLRWVKDNEVEKKEAEAEAHKATDDIADPLKKEAEFEKEKAKAEHEIEEDKKGIIAKPGNAVLLEEEPHSHVPMSAMRKLWRDTYFLSISDLTEMGKTVWELIKRRWGRRQKGRIGAAGRMMFGNYSTALGAEFKSIAQAAENEEVNHHVHVMETQGIEDIKHELHEPPDRDTLKAAITVMCKKGQMRWDDHHFWHAIEKFSGEEIRPDHYLEDIEKILDGWWGQDTFREFRNSGDSAYNSIKKNFEDNAIRLENDPNGLPGELRRLLYNFINGEHVNPCQYEEYLDFAMKAGKMAFEDKMFFLIMGVGATNPHGETLLHIDRVAALEGVYLNTLPLIDFFISPLQYRLDEKGNRIWDPKKENDDGTIGGYETGRPDVRTFKGWIHQYILPDIPSGKLEAGHLGNPSDVYWKQKKWPKGKIGEFTNFVRDTIAWDPYAAVRAEKAARDPSTWDHDDMDMFVQMLDEGTIDQITRIAGGARQQVSTSGIKNAFAGLNEFIRREIFNLDKSLREKKRIGKMPPGTQKMFDMKEVDENISAHYGRIIKMMKSFVIFDAVASTRYEHANPNRFRFSETTYNSKPGISGAKTVGGFIEEVRGVIRDVSSQLGMDQEFQKVMEIIPPTRKGEYEGQKEAIEKFNADLTKNLKEMVDRQGIEKVSAMLSRTNHLTGLIDKKTDRKAGASEMEEVKEALQTKQSGNDGEETMAHDD